MQTQRTAAEELAALRAEIVPKLARIEAVIDALMVRRVSRTEQAASAGVSRGTLWRRERKLRDQVRANGRLPSP